LFFLIIDKSATFRIRLSVGAQKPFQGAPRAMTFAKIYPSNEGAAHQKFAPRAIPAFFAHKPLKSLKTTKNKFGLAWFGLAPGLVWLGARLGLAWRPAWFGLDEDVGRA
jgi:hypothetical protein